MSEPLDPATAGVATALKSLRSRVGLRVDRLADTDIAVDALAGLTTVQQLVATGASVEEAIVGAVRDAAATLEPTNSIVADVILGLGLLPDPLPAPDLYASDLGQRRVALLRNWQRLHELRSVTWDAPVPSRRALRFEVETHALTSLALALTTAGDGISPSLAIPGSTRTTSESSSQTRLTRSPIPLVSDEFQRIADALRGALVTHENDVGWAQYLQKGSLPPTPLSTSYGLRTMILIEGSLAADLVPVVDFLRRQIAPGGAYAPEATMTPRAEGTAPILDALHQVDGTNPFTEHVASMKRRLGDFERTRPFILSSVLETSVRSGHDPDLIRMATRYLLDARSESRGLRVWLQMAEKDLIDPSPSVPHTARAVRALVLSMTALAEDDPLYGQVHDAVEEAGAWLAKGQSLENKTEVAVRPIESGTETVYFRHFTAALVVKALVSLGFPATHHAVSTALRQVWRDYHHDTARWRWPNGELPVWMTFDSVEALHLAAFAIPTPMPDSWA
jgi:hypothetical protein